jgi:hypothetical protein
LEGYDGKMMTLREFPAISHQFPAVFDVEIA